MLDNKDLTLKAKPEGNQIEKVEDKANIVD
jgi:hypothetical protein